MRRNEQVAGGDPADATEQESGFIGREWVFAAINVWRDTSSAPRYLVIKGEPGIGKTSLAKHLVAQSNLSASHFCIARRADTLDPLAFAQSLSRQLSTLPGFREAITTRRSVDVVGYASANVNLGHVTGIHVEHLENISVQTPSAVATFNELVIYPLQELFAGGFDKPLVILVDALDEAGEYQGGDTIVTLLANAQGLPPQVRFIVTSRPDNTLLRPLDLQQRSLLIDAESRENMDDVRRYAQTRIDASPALQAVLGAYSMEALPFVAQAVAASNGNFLYMAWLLRSIENGTWHPNTLDHLPQGLDALYREYLSARHLGPEQDEWASHYQPVLGVLAAARAPLTIEQICAFAGLAPEEAHRVIVDIQQFLDPRLFETNRYELYHQSVVDFLGDRDCAKEFWIDLDVAHQRVISHYRNAEQPWSEVNWEHADAYGLRYLSAHLYARRNHDDARRDLYALICQPFMEAKRQRFGSYEPFATDVAFTIEIAQAEPDGDLMEEIRSRLIYAMICSLSTTVSPDLLRALTTMGQAERARAIARLSARPEHRCQAYQAIATALLGQDLVDEAREVARDAMDAFNAIEDDRTKGLVLDALPEQLATLGEMDDLHRLLTWAREVKDSQPRGWTLERIMRALLVGGDAPEAIAVGRSIDDSSTRDRFFYEAALYLSSNGARDEALEAATTVQDDWLRASSLIAAAWALARTGEDERAKAALAMIANLRRRAEGYSLVSRNLRDAGQTGEAAAFLDWARETAEIIVEPQQRSWANRTIAVALGFSGDLDQALSIADSIDFAPAKVHALVDLAKICHEAENTARAAACIEGAVGHIEDIGDADSAKVSARSALAECMALVGDERALTTVESMVNDVFKVGALSRIAATYLTAGKVNKALDAANHALEIAASLDEQRGFILNEPLVQALTVLLSTDQTDHALSLLAAVPNGFPRGWVLEQLSGALVQAGVIDEALKIAASIDDDHYRRYAIGGIIRALHQEHKADEIVAVVEDLPGAASEIDLLSDAALCLHQLGRLDNAQRLINKAILAAERASSVRVARAEDGMIDDPLPWALIAIANALVKEGKAHEAAKVTNAIREIADQSQDASLNSLLFALAAKILSEAREDDEAAVAAAAAVDGSESAQSESRWTSEGRRAACALAEGGFFDQALSIAATVNQPTVRMLTHGEVAIIAGAAGDTQQVLAASSTIRDQAQTIDPASGALALSLLAQALGRIRQNALSNKVIEEARVVATKAPDGEIRASALDAVAMAFVQAGERSAAMSTVQEIASAERRDRSLCAVAIGIARMGDVHSAMAIVEMIGQVYWRSEALFGVVEAAVTSSDTKRLPDIVDRLITATTAIPGYHPTKPWRAINGDRNGSQAAC